MGSSPWRCKMTFRIMFPSYAATTGVLRWGPADTLTPRARCPSGSMVLRAAGWRRAPAPSHAAAAWSGPPPPRPGRGPWRGRGRRRCGPIGEGLGHPALRWLEQSQRRLPRESCGRPSPAGATPGSRAELEVGQHLVEADERPGRRLAQQGQVAGRTRGSSGRPGATSSRRPCSRACRAVMSAPLRAGASTTMVAWRGR